MKQNTSELREIVVDFYKLLRTGDRSEDVVLEDGDVIDIPKKPQVVLVSGCVSQPGGIVFQEKANLKYYVQKAGGYSWDADAKRTKVIKATGEIKDDEDVDTLIPGDRIWVPRKPDPECNTKKLTRSLGIKSEK
jgi:protein involved in polysaccharide export with SLBB domain